MSANVLDVAKYVLSKQPGPITTMKLQKLVYYSQAWHLVWTGNELFSDDIQAWANGPVVRALFDAHRGKYSVSYDGLTDGNESALSPVEQNTIDRVLDAYGPMSAMKLSLLTHAEDPWRLARGDVSDTARSAAVISTDNIAAYYRGLAHTSSSISYPTQVEFPAWA